MKKVMIMAAVVCAAIAAQAMGSYQVTDWGKLYTSPDKKSYYTGTATLHFSVAGTEELITLSVNSEGDIDPNENQGDFQVIDITGMDADWQPIWGQQYTAYYTYESGGRTFTSNTLQDSFEQFTTDLTFNAGQGSWSSVPEPTSALLMLLGMAGLALKRKKA